MSNLYGKFAVCFHENSEGCYIGEILQVYMDKSHLKLGIRMQNGFVYISRERYSYVFDEIDQCYNFASEKGLKIFTPEEAAIEWNEHAGLYDHPDIRHEVRAKLRAMEKSAIKMHRTKIEEEDLEAKNQNLRSQLGELKAELRNLKAEASKPEAEVKKKKTGAKKPEAEVKEPVIKTKKRPLKGTLSLKNAEPEKAC